MTSAANHEIISLGSCEEKSLKNFFNACVKLMIMREFSRVRREPSRIFGMMLQPLIFLCVFGLGFHSSFQFSQAKINYASFFFPGVLALVVLFSSIYSTLTLIDDRSAGFFRYVAISPGGLKGAILGKILATCLLGFSQSLFFLPLIFVLDISVSILAIAKLVGILFLGSMVFSTLGVLFAWISPSSSAFHALMSIFLIPMWLLSGAMFPLEHQYLQVLELINPMSHLVFSLRACLVSLDGSIILRLSFLMLFFVAFVFLLFRAIAKKGLE